MMGKTLAVFCRDYQILTVDCREINGLRIITTDVATISLWSLK